MFPDRIFFHSLQILSPEMRSMPPTFSRMDSRVSSSCSDERAMRPKKRK